MTIANRYMSTELVQLESFVTLFYGRFNTSSNTLTYVDAGHTQTMHYKKEDDSVEFLKGDGFPLGFSATELYEQSEVSLASGDVVLLYSDGMSEATDPAGLAYGPDRIAAFVREHASTCASDIVSGITRDVIAFRTISDFDDDLTCLAIKTNQSCNCSRRLVLRGDVDNLERLRQWLANTISAGLGIPPDHILISNTQLAAQEAFTNVTFHGLLPGGSQEITITVKSDHLAVELELQYDGKPFIREDAGPPSLDGSSDDGFGLFLIDELMDEVSYKAKGRRNFIRLRKAISQPKDNEQ
jgi:anti-sigma regulatory factor (Ser/Thr protein kinase)